MAKKPVTAKAMRDASVDDLKTRLEESKAELFKMRVGQTTKELTDASQIRKTRRTVARILTVMNQKKKAASSR